MRTTAGADWQAGVMGNTASNGTGAYAPANYIGVTANSNTPNAGDTFLNGEVTSGSLSRAQATYAHTLGTSSYTLTHVFTSDQTITLQKIGVFTSASGGVMVFESALNASAALISGDQLMVVETVSI